MTERLRGSFIVVVGPDGTGKTTLAHALADRFGDSKYFHFLPRPLWRLADRPGPPGELVEKNSDTGSVLGDGPGSLAMLSRRDSDTG